MNSGLILHPRLVVAGKAGGAVDCSPVWTYNLPPDLFSTTATESVNSSALWPPFALLVALYISYWVHVDPFPEEKQWGAHPGAVTMAVPLAGRSLSQGDSKEGTAEIQHHTPPSSTYGSPVHKPVGPLLAIQGVPVRLLPLLPCPAKPRTGNH